MEINTVNPFFPAQWQKKAESNTAAAERGQFGDFLQQAINDVNQLQKKAEAAAVSLALGEVEDVHQVMIAMEQAKLAMELTVQVRNKMVDAYQEIMRMQI
ncbi:MAG: flagellar hook-basal body complex protein FliE [Firmicutes bacterium]|nr:flagellar hook-basal body complex protein FliE [Bacillota bacterium]